MRLTATTHTLELVTSSAAGIEYTLDYHDMVSSPAFTPGSTQGSIAAATDTVILAAPAANTWRRVVRASFRNTHASTSNTVTVQKDVSATEYQIATAELAAGETLHYQDGRGFYVTDSAGKEKVTELGAGEVIERHKSRANTDAVTASSVAEVDILNYSVPANAMGANGRLRFESCVEWTNNGGVASTLRVRIYLGATTLLDETLAAPALDADRRAVVISGTLVNQNATNDQAGYACVSLGAAVAATVGFGDLDTANLRDALLAFAAGALDTTAAQTFRISLTLSVNNAGNTFTRKFSHVDVTQAA